jgi:hypothetical protein
MAVSYPQTEELDLLAHDMLFQPTYEEEMMELSSGSTHHQPHSSRRQRRRARRQAIKGAARDEESVVSINDTDIFHGPHVELPEISFKDMASFVNQAQRTIEARFEELEKEIYQSSARQVWPY